MQPKSFVTALEGQKLVGLSRHSWDAAFADGLLPEAVKIGSRLRWRRSELLLWAEGSNNGRTRNVGLN